jgi:hypothetical protein
MANRVLGLTSPHMHGDDVRALQKALKTNVFHKDYMPDATIDGVFSTFTAQGAYRAQYWLGYAKPSHKAGTPLVAYLNGTKKLTAAMTAKRKARIDAYNAAHPLRLKAFESAKRFVGTKESPPGSNRQKFGEWYGWNGVAWCAIFVSYNYASAGSKMVLRRKRWAYCPYLWADAQAGRYGLSVTRSPQRGDIVIYGKSLPHHTELFDEWIQQGSTFATIGGNTSPNNMSNGGEVHHYDASNPRTMSDVAGFAHLAA